MNAIALKSLLRGKSRHLGLTGTMVNNGLTKAVSRVILVQNAQACHTLSEGAPPTIFVVAPASFHYGGSSCGDQKGGIASLIKSSDAACLALAGISPGSADMPEITSGLAMPVICSYFDEFLLTSRLTGLLREKLEHRTCVHGVLVNMYGVGVILMGDSGCGKTTAALELAERGHQWIADDAVEIEKLAGNRLYARSHARSKGLLEIKGRGIIEAGEILPAVAIGEQAPLGLIVEMPGYAGSVPVGNSKRAYRRIMEVRLPVLRLFSLSRGDWYRELEREARLLRRMG